jgi:hypothetical protein
LPARQLQADKRATLELALDHSAPGAGCIGYLGHAVRTAQNQKLIALPSALVRWPWPGLLCLGAMSAPARPALQDNLERHSSVH